MDRRAFLRFAWVAAAVTAAESVLNLLARATAIAKPIQAPIQARKWAMVVSLDACAKKSGCRDCLDACHRIHNVPNLYNPKGEVKWIWTAPYRDVFPEQAHRHSREDLRNRPVLVLCNHCENPPCVSVCPTKATFKRDDGIVMMDFHRCIGCRYCMAACPYGARSFNWRDPRSYLKEINQDFPTRVRGVVEKCNFCEERLAKGLQPACVEACKEKGLVFGDLNAADSEASKILNARFSIQRKPHLGTEPKVYYIL
jgi:Fe-S-cluster-containing dehydrogenase component